MSFLYCVCFYGMIAAPTQRPLRPGVVDADEDFTVLRDHQLPKQFYLLPKRLELYENAVQPFGAERGDVKRLPSTTRLKRRSWKRSGNMPKQV